MSAPDPHLRRDELVAHWFKTDLVNGLTRAMKQHGITRSELARRMKTSRAVTHRLMKPEDYSLNLSTLAKAVLAVGGCAQVRLIPVLKTKP